MSLKTWIAKRWAGMRAAEIEKLGRQPEAAQRRLLTALLKQARGTTFGKDHGFGQLASYEAYRAAVPLRDYEALKPYVERAYAGERDVLWPGQPAYFAKTSGTTSGTKYIPITRGSMACQVKGARDALLLYIHLTGKADFLTGKMMFLSGSPLLEKNAAGIPVGRLSGISAHFVPAYLQQNRLPAFATNCIEDWETKVAAVVEETKHADMRLISGIPPWVRMYFEALRAKTGELPARRWPNLQLFIQGGVDYAPYAALITQAMGRKLDIVEVYPASEGFIAVQDTRGEPGALSEAGMRLMLDYGIFFEFIPLAEYGRADARRLPLWGVAPGQPYAILLTTNAGLWAYDLGDTVTFTSVAPYRLKVSGRVKHFISAFGEHVIESEINGALIAATEATGAQVAEYTVAPFVNPEGISYHEWLIEFRELPLDMSRFREKLDETLQTANSYYRDLRAGNMLSLPEVRPLSPGAAEAYMRSIGRLGGQNKFQRVSNDRRMSEALAPYFLEKE